MFKFVWLEFFLKIFKIILKLDIYNFVCIWLIIVCMFDINVYMVLFEEFVL